MSTQVASRFALLKPVASAPRTDLVTVLEPGQAFDWVVTGRRGRNGLGPLALDFETRGDWGSPDTHPVGCALSDARGSCYVPFPNASVYRRLMRLLTEEQTPLIAHNVFFDGGWPVRDFGDSVRLNWKACTYATYKLLATEGWDGQKWGLKDAQVTLLGWPESNEGLLYSWLVQQGWTNSTYLKPGPGRYATTDGRWATPDKGEMWRAPSAVLGQYSALDADACWQLWQLVLEPALSKGMRFEGVRKYWDMYPAYIRTLIDQRVRGIAVDKGVLDDYSVQLAAETQATELALRARGEVSACLQALGRHAAAEALGPEPAPQFKPGARLGREPARTRRDGTPSPAWAKWDLKRGAILAAAPELTYRWAQWAAKRATLQARAQSGQLWSIGSGADRRKLLYGQAPFGLGFRSDSLTASGLEAVGEASLLGCGEVGAALISWDTKNKLGQFCTQVRDLLHPDGCDKHTLHPGFRVPATLTGRLGGKQPNIQQMPNDRRFLSAFRARPGYRIVAVDVVSLENYVLAELSLDPALLRLYGPGARPGQDAYLFNAAQLPVIGPRIRATGYDPLTATAEETALAKKACKKDRQIGKTITLACLAEGTLVRVAGRGWVPIEEVEQGDRCWDGDSWISCDGSIDKGLRQCHTMEGVTLTPDHKLLGQDGQWHDSGTFPAGTAGTQLLRPQQPSAGWADVWQMARSFFRRLAR